MAQPDEPFLGELRLSGRITAARHMAAVGLVVFAGLFFVLGERTLALVGGSMPLAALLAGSVIGLSLLNTLELLGGARERAGTYQLISETLEGLGGFLVGWSLVAAALGLSVALARGFGERIRLLIPHLSLSAAQIGVLLLVILIALQLFQWLPRHRWLWPASLVILGLITLTAVADLLGAPPALIRAWSFRENDSLLRAAAWLATGYAGLEAILTSRRPVGREPRRVFIALTSALIIGGLLFAEANWVLLPRLEMAGSGLEEPAASLHALLVGPVAAVALALASNACLMLAVRALHALSRRGALPAGLRSMRRPFRLPPLLFFSALAACLSLAFWVPPDLTLDLAAACLLFVMIMTQLALIHSRRVEPERRRAFVVPLHPLAPGLGLGLGLALILALPVSGLLATAGWLLLGAFFYTAYVRSHQLEAQEGLMVFGRGPHGDDLEARYRILVPVAEGVERHLVLGLASALACHFEGEVIPLQVIRIPDPLAIEEGKRIARERNTLFQWSTRLAARPGVKSYPITRLARSVPDGILETANEERCDLILMTWAWRGEARRDARMGRVLDPVVRRAPCDVAVVAFSPEQIARLKQARMDGNGEAGLKPAIGRILVPTAGGPHAPLAIELAVMLAREFEAEVQAVYVADPDANQADLDLGRTRIKATLDAVRARAQALTEEDGGAQVPMSSRVVRAESVTAGIVEAGADCDLVMIGASEESVIDQVLFGTLPEQVARQSPAPVVMVRRYRGLRRFWLQRVWDALTASIPRLDTAEQLAIYKEIRRGARPDVDFFAMIGLSAVIATFGLLQGSGAVIIGAMLVAPLFTPILALSLAIVRGEIRMFRLAAEAAIKGIVLAVGLAIALVALQPLRPFTDEIAARTTPNLFDLAVALASGAAGAYALARKDVAASLPGVAIAAALVPPLCVIGIGLATNNPQTAGGATLLFGTNLIAIVLAGSVTLLLLGFRPTARSAREVVTRRGLVTSLGLLVVIAIPLSLLTLQALNESRTRLAIEDTLRVGLEQNPAYQLVDFEFENQGDQLQVVTTVYSRQLLDGALVRALQAELARSLGRAVRLELRSIPIEALEAGP